MKNMFKASSLSIQIVCLLFVVFASAQKKNLIKNSPNEVLNSGITPEKEAKIQKRVEEIFKTLTIEKKIDQLMGLTDNPKLMRGEAISGINIDGATTLPQQIGISCSWNPELLEINTSFTSKLMRNLGMTLALSPMLDVSRNARWGRMEESFGESAYLTSRMGLAFVRGMQTNDLSKGVATTTKHFAGYGGNNNNLHEFYEETLMPHEVVVRLGNTQSLMPGYHANSGIPCHASPFLLKEILRDKWKFDGTVVSDYFAVKQIYSAHKYVGSKLEAGAKALESGVDVEFPNGDAYKSLAEALQKGLVTQEQIDQAVKRVLTLKGRLGLLDPNNPIVINKKTPLDPDDYRERAYISACQSLVLLKNDGVLPIKKEIKRIAVVGPNADAFESLLGDYTNQTLKLYWGKKPINPNNPKLFTLLEGLKNKVDKSVTIVYERGCEWTNSYKSAVEKVGNIGDEREKKVLEIASKDFGIPNPEKAIADAASSDIIIAAMGENRYLCGEGRDRKDIRLAGDQEEFVKKLIATGKPVVLIIFGGRPHVLTAINDGCKAIIQAWYPGEEGGNAVADLLLGNINPSGKMTVTVPRTNEQCPIWHGAGYKKENMPLYPFGHGLSYTTFSYSNLKAPKSAKTSDEWISIEFDVKNTGDRTGTEIAQLYVSANGLSMPRPALKLEGFTRVEIKKGNKTHIQFLVSPQQLAFLNKDMQWVIEPGNYDFMVGASSTDIKFKANVELKGTIQNLKQKDVFFSETIVK